MGFARAQPILRAQKAFGSPASLRMPLAVNFDFSFRSTVTRIPDRGCHQNLVVATALPLEFITAFSQ